MAFQGTYMFKLVASTPLISQVSSIPIEVEVVDLCNESDFIGQEPAIPAVVEATYLGPEKCIPFAEPITQVALDLDIARICGAPQYELRADNVPQNQNYATLDPVTKEICIKSEDEDEIGD